MFSVVGILIAAVILTLCVCLHEFGHMAAAKRFGVGVVEYSVGMGRLVKWKRIGDTVYSLRLIPIGGYCAMYGEQSLEALGKGDGERKAVPDYKTDWRPEQSLDRASVWHRILIYVAGPCMNFVLGLAACALLLFVGDFATVPVVSEIMEDHPAASVDVRPGDIVAGVNGHMCLTWNDYSEWMASHPAEVADGWDLMLFRDGSYHTVRATRSEEDDMFGFYVTFEPVEMTPGNFVLYFGDCAAYMARSVFDSIGMLVRGDAKVSDLSGVIGITASMGDAVESVVESVENYEPEEDEEEPDRARIIVESVVGYAVFMLALISVNLGIMNLIPIPALDGGRVLLCGVEAVMRRRVPEKVEYALNAVSMSLLMALMFYVCVNDVVRIVVGILG